jgi:hypothetical protein
MAEMGIIFVSSVGARHELSERLRRLGAIGWRMKPVPQSALYNSLMNLRARPADGGTKGGGTPGRPRNGTSAGRWQLSKVLRLPEDRKLKALFAEDHPIKLARLGVIVKCCGSAGHDQAASRG